MINQQKLNWNHDSLFPLSEAFVLGQRMAADIGERIIGRIAGNAPDHGVLAQMVHNAGDGDHLEIGSLFGGSAILAALVKQHYHLGGKVICIDPMTGYYGKPDPFSGLMATQELFYQNLASFGLSEQVELIVAQSNQYSLPQNKRYVSVFIDGAHDYDSVLADWNQVKQHTLRYVLFDNYDRAFEGVQAAVRIAYEERNWRCALIYGISALFERVNDAA